MGKRKLKMEMGNEVVLVHNDILKAAIPHDLSSGEHNLLYAILAYMSSHEDDYVPLEYFQKTLGLATMNDIAELTDSMRRQLSSCRFINEGNIRFDFSLLDTEIDFMNNRVKIIPNPNLEYIYHGYTEPECLIDFTLEGITNQQLKTAKLMYVLMSATKDKGETAIGIEALKEILEIPDATRPTQIKVKYIDPAMVYLKPYFGEIDITPRKMGRKIIGYGLKFRPVEKVPGFSDLVDMRNYPDLKAYVYSGRFASDYNYAAELVGEKNAEDFMSYTYRHMIDILQKTREDKDPLLQSVSYRKKAMERLRDEYVFKSGKCEGEEKEDAEVKKDMPVKTDRICTCGYPLYEIARKDSSGTFLGHTYEQQKLIAKDKGTVCRNTFSSADLKETGKQTKEISRVKITADYLAYVREKNNEEHKSRLEKIRNLYPEEYARLEKLTKEISRVSAEILCADADGKINLMAETGLMIAESKKIKAEVLEKEKLDSGYLDEIYMCEICQDTGFERDTGEKCRCYKKHSEDAILWYQNIRD